ncbi:MAG: lipopolysaccharide biosynthesis protein [Bacteroides sp.]|nr:lipopolysaccharide biosynthesis protein [Bacteroides sp.]
MSSDTQLKQRTAKGLLWGGIGNGAMQLLNLVFGIFLARLLTPADYGVVGALTIFSATAGLLSESGFTLAIVNKREVSDADYNAVFWFNVAASLTLYLILFCCAPAIARFYKTPEMLPLARFLFTSFVFGGLATAPAAYLFRNLMVKQRSQIQILAIVISGTVGVICAFNGWGYWGIALQTVLYSSANCIMMWIICRWRPSFSFRFDSLKSMLPFSLRQLVTSMFTHINNNFFSVLLGRFYGMRITGFYTQGNKWTTMGYSTLVGMINSVGQPVLRQTIDDPARLLRVFRKLLRFTAFVSFPAMLGLALVAHDLIVITISDKWLDSVAVMQILCLGGAVMPLSILYGNLFNSIGRPDIYMWNTIALGLLQLAGVCLTYPFGLETMLAIYVAINILWLLVWQFFTRRHIGLTYLGLLKDIAPYAILSAGVMIMTWFSTRGIENPYIALPAKILIAAGAYSLLLWKFNSAVFRESIDFILKRKKSL